jgi:hypothetical protein
MASSLSPLPVIESGVTHEKRETKFMTWTELQFEEISLGCEINSHASAEI